MAAVLKPFKSFFLSTKVFQFYFFWGRYVFWWGIVLVWKIILLKKNWIFLLWKLNFLGINSPVLWTFLYCIFFSIRVSHFFISYIYIIFILFVCVCVYICSVLYIRKYFLEKSLGKNWFFRNKIVTFVKLKNLIKPYFSEFFEAKKWVVFENIKKKERRNDVSEIVLAIQQKRFWKSFAKIWPN